MANCEAYWELLSAGLDGALTPEEQARLEEHLAQCPDCRALYSEMRSLGTELAGLESPSPGFAGAVMSAVAETEQERPSGETGQKRPHPRRRPLRTVGALAACCVLALGLGALLAQNGLSRTGASNGSTGGAMEIMDTAETTASPAGEEAAAETEDEAAMTAEDSSAPSTEDGIDQRPAIYMDGRAYINPDPPVNELPEGFVPAGRLTEEQAGDVGLAGYEYYADPDLPGEFYIYQQCGTPIGGNTVDTTQLQWAYIRWVTAD